ncbi:MAG: PQQ-like beta-propeller repeat protein [Anaerolineae bacterium]|nr:PQQ-like beta-propeller repeat protein [Anaerolineae bacterium]
MKKPAIFVFISIGILLIAVSALIVLSISIDNHTRREAYTFNLEETVGTWNLLWEKQNLHLGWVLPRNQFVATMNTLCYVGPQEDSLFHQISLICVNIHDGKQKWIGQADSGSSIESDEKQVYVGGLSVRAYNAENGQKVWGRGVDARSITGVTAYNGFVNVRATPNQFSVFDANNGTLQVEDSIPFITPHSFASDEQKIFEQFGGQVGALNIQDDTLIWDIDFRNELLYRSVFSNGFIIVRSGWQKGTIHVIDSETGRQIWEKEGIASDFGINDTTLFFVTTQGEILAVDLETGEIQGRLILNGGELNTQGNVPNNTSYIVRTVDDVVLVYLGDTGQLFSFRYANE